MVAAIAISLLSPALLGPSTAHAKAWTQPEGDGYAKVWARGIFGGDAFAADGSIEPSKTYQDVSLRHYVEYGLTDDWTLLSYGAPAGFAAYGDNSTGYVGPLALGIRRGFIDGPVQLAAEVHYGYAPPVGDDDLAAQDAALSYRPAVDTHLGVGELQVGYGLGWGWMVASVGFQWNSADEIDSAVTGFAQLGAQLAEAWTAETHLALYEPLGDVEVTNVSGVGQTRYLGFGLGLSWWMTESLGLSVGLGGAVATKSNASTPSLTTGVEGRF
jgi:hypothetical protein